MSVAIWICPGGRFIHEPRASHANSLTVRLGSAPGVSKHATPPLTGRVVEGALAAEIVATARTHSSVRSS